LALASGLRPDLHRYCARLMGSVIEGEDVVQDTMVRALEALTDLDSATPLRPWLFRIAHNRALDLLRSRAVRQAESLEAAADVPDPSNPDPLEVAMRQDSLRTAVSRFAALPIHQRSTVILKDVLDESLSEIAAVLNMSVDAVKGHLARGRARLSQLNEQTPSSPAAPVASDSTLRYIALFNQRDWHGLRALLADDVKLNQSSHPMRSGAADVRFFFTKYADFEGLWLAPAWLDGREVIAVFDDRAAARPSYFMWLEWRGGQIAFIHDYCHVRYVALDAEIELLDYIHTGP
jgi:RNA polymerase sigma-70 factor (ECF subfamily)